MCVVRLLLACVATATALSPATTSNASPAPAVPHASLVRLPFPQDDGTLTPYTFDVGYSLMTLVYDTLLWRGVSGTPEPWLGRIVESSAGGLELTLRLAEARWQDGPPVTSADVAFTYAYMRRHPHPRFTNELGDIAGVRTPDSSTVVFSLVHASPGFAEMPLADVPILPEHLWATLAAGESSPPGLPVGSGPYRLVEHTTGQDYRFEANTGYFRGAPAVTTIEVPIIRDAAATAQALESRLVDMVPITLPASLLASTQGLGVQTATGESYLGTVLLLNVHSRPFDQREVRDAVAEALDLGQIARAVGDAVPADHGYLHPDSGWAPTQVLHQTDTNTARVVLSSVTDRALDVLVTSGDPGQLEAARQVVAALGRVGLPATVQEVSRQAFDTAIGAHGSAATFQLAIGTSPSLATYDPDLLAQLFGSGGLYNYTGYSSAAFDNLATRIVSTDGVTRTDAVAAALRLLASDAPVIPLFFSNGAFAYRPAVYSGWVYVRGSGILDKLSFVEPAAVRPTSPAPGVPPEAPGSFSILSLVALVLAAGVVLVGGLQLVRGRQR